MKEYFFDELAQGMQREMQPLKKKEGMKNLDKTIDYLQGAMEIFEKAGLISQANQVLNLLVKIAQQVNDPAVKGLTSEKMVDNLKHHGIVFNVPDDPNDLLEKEIDENNLEVEDPEAEDFEEEK